MVPKRISVSIGCTINTGNYSSVRVEERLEVELEETDMVGDSINKTKDFLEARIHDDAIAVAKNLKKKGLVG